MNIYKMMIKVLKLKITFKKVHKFFFILDFLAEPHFNGKHSM